MNPALLPALQIHIGDQIFIGDFWGFIVALPIALFLAYWISDVKNHVAVVVGAFIGALIGFFGILGWVGTLIFTTDLPGADGASTFFSSIFICGIAALVCGMLTDLIVARRNKRDYRRPIGEEAIE